MYTDLSRQFIDKWRNRSDLESKYIMRWHTKAKLLIMKPVSWLSLPPTTGIGLLSPCRQNIKIQMTKTQMSAVAEMSWANIFWPRRRTDKGRTSTTAIYLIYEIKRRRRTRYPNEKRIYVVKGDPDDVLTEVSLTQCQQYPRRYHTANPTLGKTDSATLVEQLNQNCIHALWFISDIPTMLDAVLTWQEIMMLEMLTLCNARYKMICKM